MAIFTFQNYKRPHSVAWRYFCHFFLASTTGVRGIVGSAYWSLCHIVPEAPVSAPCTASFAGYFFCDFFLSHVINSSFHCRRDPDNTGLFIFGKEKHWIFSIKTFAWSCCWGTQLRRHVETYSPLYRSECWEARRPHKDLVFQVKRPHRNKTKTTRK